MDINRINSKVLEEETTLGIYVWEMPDGRWIGDDNGNFLSITSKKGNRSKVDALAREVRSFGIYEGGPKFLSGRDHTTVIHAIKKVEELMIQDKNFENEVKDLNQKLTKTV